MLEKELFIYLCCLYMIALLLKKVKTSFLKLKSRDVETDLLQIQTGCPFSTKSEQEIVALMTQIPKDHPTLNMRGNISDD
jgi:hypothetical protein